MRTARRKEQRMFYANLHESTPIYQTDEYGNIVYRTMPDGEQMPIKIGETKPGYDEPTEFWNSISGTLTEDELEAFGSENGGVAKITYHKGEYPFRVGTLIWKDSEVGYIDGEVDENTADYRIMGVLTTGQHFYRAILEEAVKGEGV